MEQRVILKHRMALAYHYHTRERLAKVRERDISQAIRFMDFIFGTAKF
jgi:hypothetical protein